MRLKQPTRKPARAARRGRTRMLPYLVLLRVGFTVPRTVTGRAVRSYRTFSPLPAPKRLGGMFSVALSVGSRRPGVTWHPALRSPDFPPRPKPERLPGRLPANIVRLRGARLTGAGIHALVASASRRWVSATGPPLWVAAPDGRDLTAAGPRHGPPGLRQGKTRAGGPCHVPAAATLQIETPFGHGPRSSA